MGEFKICVTYFIRLDGKVRDRDALVRKVSGGVRGFRKKQSEIETRRRIKEMGGGGRRKVRNAFYSCLLLFLYSFYLSTYILAHQLDILSNHCTYA